MDILNNVAKNKGVISGVLIYSVISLMIIFFNHHYYDDEIFNLRIMPLSLGEIISYIHSKDVHPSLSYVINKAIYELFSSYKAILVFSILFNVVALAYFYNFAEKKLHDAHAKLLLFIFVFMNGGLLLWTNSVRWYAYWVPLFVILYTYLLKNPKLTMKQVVVVGLLLVAMTYISYLTFVLLIGLLAFFLISRKHDLSIKNIAVLGAIYFSLSSYQIYIAFITGNLQRKESQVSDFITSLLNAIYGVINGGSVFLADPLFLVFSLFTLIIMVLGLKSVLADNKKRVNPLFVQSTILFVGLFTLFVITGLSSKFRNNIALSIPFYFIMSYFLVHIKNINVKRLYLLSALALSVISIFNLILHQNTAKISYNMPIDELAAHLQGADNKLIVTYSTAIYFHFVNHGYKVIYLKDEYPARVVSKGTNVYLIETYRGAIHASRPYEKVLQFYNKIGSCLQEKHKDEIGVDKYYKVKNKLRGKRAEVDRVQMHVTYGEARDDCTIPAWSY